MSPICDRSIASIDLVVSRYYVEQFVFKKKKTNGEIHSELFFGIQCENVYLFSERRNNGTRKIYNGFKRIFYIVVLIFYDQDVTNY